MFEAIREFGFLKTALVACVASALLVACYIGTELSWHQMHDKDPYPAPHPCILRML